ncbi:MAG: hypothetical protein RR623_08905 [Bacilli bacterium]
MNKMIIRFRKKDIPKYIIWAEILLVCFSNFFIDILQFPTFIKYSMDFLNFLLVLFILIVFFKKKKIKSEIKILGLIILGLLLFSLSSLITKQFNFILVVWSIRNTFRFLIFFLSCTVFLNYNDYEYMIGKINKILVINFFMCLYEFLILGYSGDFVGGGFGISAGCNAPLNVLIVIATVYNAVLYMQRRNKLNKLIVYITLCSIIAGFAELKIYVVEVLLILVLTGVFSKGFLKKTSIILMSIVFMMLCIRLIEILIPGWENFFTIKNLYEMASTTQGYTNSGDLNRLTSITELNDLFFKNSVNWTGFGLGNCEFSDTFGFLNSNFANAYGYLHYSWFSVAKIYLELGWIGVITSIGIWVYTLHVALKRNTKWKISILIMVVMAILFFFYNYTMNLDSAYLVYAFLAGAYLSEKHYI